MAVIKAAVESGITEVIVAYSGGKDSLAVLDLCCKYFKRVVPYWMYVVNGLSFHESHHAYIEAKYGVKIIRVPDWRLAHILRSGVCRYVTGQAKLIPSVTVREIENSIRLRTGIHWVASGETCGESLQRRGMIVGCNGICPSRGHIYPIGWWRRRDVHSYLSQNRIVLSSEYRVMTDGRSFSGIEPKQVLDIKKHFPADYEKIKKMFPLIEAQCVRREAAILVEQAEEAVKKEVSDKVREEKEAAVALLQAEKKATREAKASEKKAERDRIRAEKPPKVKKEKKCPKDPSSKLAKQD